MLKNIRVIYFKYIYKFFIYEEKKYIKKKKYVRKILFANSTIMYKWF
jgi:hypothetical protein